MIDFIFPVAWWGYLYFPDECTVGPKPQTIIQVAIYPTPHLPQLGKKERKRMF